MWLIQLWWHWGNPVGHMYFTHMDEAGLCTVTVNRDLQYQEYWQPQGSIWQWNIVNHSKLQDNWGPTFAENSVSAVLLCALDRAIKLHKHMRAWLQSKWIYNENSPLFYRRCAGSQYENTDDGSAKIRFYRQTHQRLQTWFIHAAHERFNKGFAFPFAWETIPAEL